MTPAPARTRARTHARTAPHAPRRVSGPVTRRMVAAPAGTGALRRRGTTSVFGRVRALPEHRVVDRLLRSRAWIWALGALLGGIVAMQVSLLKLNSGISRAVTTTTTLERQNADLEASIARLTATDRIQTGAEGLGMLMPAAGEVGYLSAGPQDAARAVRRMQPPSEEAAQLLANGGDRARLARGRGPGRPGRRRAARRVRRTGGHGGGPDDARRRRAPPADPVPVATPVATPVPTAAPPTTTSLAGGAVAPQG